MLMKHGKPGIKQFLKTAHEFPIEGIMNHDGMMDEVQDYYMNGYPKGIRVGIPAFDDLISFMPGQLTIVTGIPGSGKSEYIDYLMAMASINHGLRHGICSWENQPASLHISKIMEKLVGKSFMHRLDASSRISMDEFNWAAAMVKNHYKFFNVSELEADIDILIAKARELVLRYGIHFLLLDPWNYIEMKIPNGMTETQYVSIILSKLKALAIATGLHIFLVAHPIKMPKVNGRYEVPTLYNISGSAHFFNKTDNGITVYRDFENGTVDIHIQKVRYSWNGKLGACSFTYNTETRQYIPCDKITA